MGARTARGKSEQDAFGGFTPVMAFVRAFAWPSQAWVPGKEEAARAWRVHARAAARQRDRELAEEEVRETLGYPQKGSAGDSGGGAAGGGAAAAAPTEPAGYEEEGVEEEDEEGPLPDGPPDGESDEEHITRRLRLWAPALPVLALALAMFIAADAAARADAAQALSNDANKRAVEAEADLAAAEARGRYSVVFFYLMKVV
ncbi:hypothetical protein T492DRAFT_842352 [Pavlovales sp. CCMP2436]|nr:hypothetical protein T492DRAFT_842352 [Pavlovales sp. CCMP2436]